MAVIDVDKIQEPMYETHASGLNLSYEWRVKQLKTVLRLIVENKDTINEAVKKDLGRHHLETICGEFKPVENEIKHILKNLKKWMEPEAVASAVVMFPSYCSVHRKPLAGPGVLIVSPFNYPFNLSLKPLIGAFAGGNPAVIKPSELAVESGKVFQELVKQYFEPGVLQIVLGSVPVSNALLEKPWGKVFFTGSPRVGKIIGEACAKTLTPVILELGGKSPNVVEEDVCSSDLQNVADRIIFGKTFNAGQTCVAPDTLFVHESHVKELCACLVQSIETQFGKDQKKGDLARIINAPSANRLRGMIIEAENSGATLIYGSSAECDPENRYICPTLILNPRSDSKVLQEEIFGPILPIITFVSRAEAFERIGGIGRNPLQFTVYTTKDAVFEEYINTCRPSAACRNDCLVQLANHNLPFGGLRGSGVGGHYFGKYSFDAFTHPLAVAHRPIGSLWDLNNLRCHPYSDWKQNILENYVMGLPDIPVLHPRRLLLIAATSAAVYAVDDVRFFLAQFLRCIAAHLHKGE